MTSESSATVGVVMSQGVGSPLERPRSVLLLLLQLALSFIAGYIVAMQTFSVTGCGDDGCGRTIWLTYIGMLALLVLLLAASTAVVIVRGVRQRPSWWAPTTAIAVIAMSTVVAIVVIHGAAAA